MTMPLRPTIGNNQITYDFGEGKGTETLHYKHSYFKSDMLTRFAEQLSNVKMDNNGNISPKDVQSIFLNFSKHIRGADEAPSLYPVLYSCTDANSDGGEMFTRGEQQKVMSIIREWTSLSWK